MWYFEFPKILAEKTKKQKPLGSKITRDRQTVKQRETKGTKRAKCYYYLIKPARVAF